MALVAATFVVGWLSHGNWRLPFLVYLIPAIPLVLSVFLRGIPKADLSPATVPTDPKLKATIKTAAKASMAGTAASAIKAVSPKADESIATGNVGRVKGDFIISRTVSLILVYFFVCYATVIVSYYLPFLMQGEGFSASAVGTVTAIFFLSVFLPGFILPGVVKVFKQSTLIVSAIVMAVGILLMVVGHRFGILCTASALVGFGYGVFQPLIYDKATRIVTVPAKSTLALAIVLAANYISISATPFIVDFFRDIFSVSASNNVFPFVLNAVLLALFTVVVLIFRKSFVFSIERSYY